MCFLKSALKDFLKNKITKKTFSIVLIGGDKCNNLDKYVQQEGKTGPQNILALSFHIILVTLQ